MRFPDFLRITVLISAAAATALAAVTVAGSSGSGNGLLVPFAAGWWVIAGLVGAWLGRRPSTSGPIAALLAGARTQPTLPEVNPGRTVLNRLWPLLLCTIGAGALAFILPQVPAVATGFAIIWALGWRRQSSAVIAIEERDGARFYVQRTSPLKPIQLVRTPGFRSNLLELNGASGRRPADPRLMARTDVLVVSVGSTGGWRAAAEELAASIARAGATVEVAAAAPAPRVRTFALTDLVEARLARRAARRGIVAHDPRAIIYCSVTAALLWPRPGAISLDSIAAENRPGRHGFWQRPVERRRLREAPLLLTWSERSLEAHRGWHADAVAVPPPVAGSADGAARRLAAVTYAGNPVKRRTALVLDAWSRARRGDEKLVVAGTDTIAPADGVEVTGTLSPEEFKALLRNARVFVAAPRREEYGIAALEALANGCQLVTTPVARSLSGAGARPRARPAARQRRPRRRRSGSRSTIHATGTPPVPPSCSSPSAASRSTPRSLTKYSLGFCQDGGQDERVHPEPC